MRSDASSAKVLRCPAPETFETQRDEPVEHSILGEPGPKISSWRPISTPRSIWPRWIPLWKDNSWWMRLGRRLMLLGKKVSRALCEPFEYEQSYWILHEHEVFWQLKSTFFNVLQAEHFISTICAVHDACQKQHSRNAAQPRRAFLP